MNFREKVHAFELKLVLDAIVATNGNKTRAAALLGIAYSSMFRILDRRRALGIDEEADDPPLAFAIASVEERNGLDRRLRMIRYACWTAEAIAAAAADPTTRAFVLEARDAERFVDRCNERLEKGVLVG